MLLMSASVDLSESGMRNTWPMMLLMLRVAADETDTLRHQYPLASPTLQTCLLHGPR